MVSLHVATVLIPHATVIKGYRVQCVHDTTIFVYHVPGSWLLETPLFFVYAPVMHGVKIRTGFVGYGEVILEMGLGLWVNVTLEVRL